MNSDALPPPPDASDVQSVGEPVVKLLCGCDGPAAPSH